MSILKSTNSGRKSYWLRILKQRKYIKTGVELNFEVYKNELCFKASGVYDGIIYIDKNFVPRVLISNEEHQLVKLIDEKHLLICETYWNIVYNNMWNDKSQYTAEDVENEMFWLKRIISYKNEKL